jgi:hypothetical protein
MTNGSSQKNTRVNNRCVYNYSFIADCRTLFLFLRLLKRIIRAVWKRLLAHSLQAIGNNKLDVALNEVDSLLKVNPNFKLAQLVKGDLLLARSQALNNFGNAPNAPRDRMEDLRDEARARLLRVQQQQPFQYDTKISLAA